MSGGCEWPRPELSEADHVSLRRDLVGRGLHDIEAPAWVVTPEDFQDWRFSRRWGCSVEAVRAWRHELTRSGDRPASANVHDPKAWVRAFDDQAAR